MNIEEHIRKSLQDAAQTFEVPAKLDALVSESRKRWNRSNRRRGLTLQSISIGVVIGVFAVSATALASPNLADRIYGSYSELKRKVVTVTIQEYQKVGMKFAGAKRELGKDYPAFEKLAQQMVSAKVEYGDKNWQIDFSTLNPETCSRLKQLYSDIQPYFDRLNHTPVARDVLSSEEYDNYITAQLQRETILAKAGVNPSAGRVQVKNIPVELQSVYEAAVQTVLEFEKRAQQSVAAK